MVAAIRASAQEIGHGLDDVVQAPERRIGGHDYPAPDYGIGIQKFDFDDVCFHIKILSIDNKVSIHFECYISESLSNF